MPSETLEQLLDRAASLYGVEPYFWDIWGHKHEITLEAKQALLRARGVAAGSAAELEQSLARRARAEWERLLPPAVVVTVAAETELPLNVAADCPHPVARVAIHREDGTQSVYEIQLADSPYPLPSQSMGEPGSARWRTCRWRCRLVTTASK